MRALSLLTMLFFFHVPISCMNNATVQTLITQAQIAYPLVSTLVRAHAPTSNYSQNIARLLVQAGAGLSVHRGSSLFLASMRHDDDEQSDEMLSQGLVTVIMGIPAALEEITAEPMMPKFPIGMAAEVIVSASAGICTLLSGYYIIRSLRSNAPRQDIQTSLSWVARAAAMIASKNLIAALQLAFLS